MSLIHIRAPNWAKFNPRSDRANYSWFRLENSYFQDQAVFMLTDSQVALHLFCLCELSKKNCGETDLRSEYIASLRRQRERDIISDLQQLDNLGLLQVWLDGVRTVESRHDAVNEPSLLPATNETNERDERTDEVVLSPAWLAKTWNENSGNLPKVKFPERLDEDRTKAARKALTLRPEATLWVEAIKRMALSDFCNGRKKSDGHDNWKAKFDHLVRPGWIDRVLEGEFDNGISSRKSYAAEQVEREGA